jgi:hypothetical protein
VLSHGDIVTLKKGALSDPGVFTFEQDLTRVKRERQDREDAAGVQRLEPEPTVSQYAFDDQRIGLPGSGYIPWSRVDRIYLAATAPLRAGDGIATGFAAGVERFNEINAVVEEDKRLFETSSTPALSGSSYRVVAMSHGAELFKLEDVDNPAAINWVAAIERHAPIDLIQPVVGL